MSLKRISSMAILSVAGLSVLTPSASAQDGNLILNTRLRAEIVDQDGRENAEALTLRIAVGYDQKLSDNWSVLGEVEGVLHLNNDFADTVKARPGLAVVADPKTLELNRLQIAYKDEKTTATLGRQRIIFDNARFIGNVGFRQNEQTFDALRASHSLTETVKAEYVFIDKVHRIFGDESPNGEFESNSHLFRLSVKSQFGDVTGYGLLLNLDESAAASGQTWGVRWAKGFETDFAKINLTAEAALQHEYKDKGPASNVGYQAVTASFTRGKITAHIGGEILEGSGGRGFVTPLSTLHKFQGWADAFLTTPANGIRDLQLGIKSSAPNFIKGQKPITFGAIYHDFASDNGAVGLGQEFDAILKIPVSSKVAFETKLAIFEGGSTGPADRNKFWVALSANF